MAPTVTAFSKKPEVAQPAFASVSAADIIRAPVVQRAIPLDLAALLRPYKRHGRLSLRVERVPQRAKFSAGRNNGDGSWSLASDELEGLTYLVPSSVAADHELAIRIMSLEEAGVSTLKVVPFPVSGAQPGEEQSEPDIRSAAHDPVQQSQLGQMQSLFAIRESELTQLRAALEHVAAGKARELADARAAWEQELNARLSEVAAQAKMARDLEQRGWQTEQDKNEALFEARTEQRLARERDRLQAQAEKRIETERQRWQAQTEQHIEAEYQRWQSQADRRLEADLQRWKTESAEAVSQAEARWHAEETARAVAAMADWERQSASLKSEAAEKFRKLESALAEAIAQGRAAPDTDQLRNDLTAMQAALAEREQELAAQRMAAAQERERWVSDEAARSATAHAQWQQQSARLLSDAADQYRSLEARLSEALSNTVSAPDDKEPEIARLRDELARTGSLLAERDQQLFQHQSALEQEREHWRQAADAALAQSTTTLNLRESENTRLRDALAVAQSVLAERDRQLVQHQSAFEQERQQWRQAADAAQSQNMPTPEDNGPQILRLQGELAMAQSLLAERDQQLVQHQTAFEQERNHFRQAAQESLQSAAQAWKTEETARLDAAVAQTRAQSAEALAIATSRYEITERALSDARNQIAAGGNRRDDAYVEGLRKELSTLRKTLVNREVELGHVRAALDQARPLHIHRAANMPVLGHLRSADTADEEEANKGARKTLIRDFVVVVCLAVPAILFYPNFAGYLPDPVRTGLATISGGLLSAGDERAAPPVAAPPPARVIKYQTALVTRAANMRATPAVKGTVVMTLPRGAQVAVMEQRGNWTRVEVAAKTAADKPKQGWVYNSFLKSDASPG